MIKVLLINHHFNQDIDALVATHDKRFEFKVISPDLFAIQARRYFPPSVFSADLSEFYREEYSDKRKEWHICAKKILQELFMLYRFDVIVSPSDTFFYLRDVINTASEIGIPFIILQKEHYMSPKSLEEHSVLMKKYFPFISDHMTVCSEMSKKFWELAGTPSEKISIIGQPRFDFYKQPEKWQSLSSLGIKFDHKLPVILFFSYDLGAYFDEFMITASKPWLQLREETEEILFDYVRRNAINLIIKPHPQQDPGDINYVRKRLSNSCGEFVGKNVLVLEGAFDTRQLIVNSDCIVSFQTTALLEALSIGKKVIYTFWTEKVNEVESKLLPYHRYPEYIDCAKSKESFREIVDDYLNVGASIHSQIDQTINKLVENYQGVIDGHASDRFLEILERFVQKSKKAQLDDPSISEKIRKLENIRTFSLVRHLAGTCIGTTLISVIFVIAYPFIGIFRKGKDIREKLKSRLSLRIMRIKECIEALSGTKISSPVIVGQPTDGLSFYFKKVFKPYE